MFGRAGRGWEAHLVGCEGSKGFGRPSRGSVKGRETSQRDWSSWEALPVGRVGL